MAAGAKAAPRARPPDPVHGGILIRAVGALLLVALCGADGGYTPSHQSAAAYRRAAEAGADRAENPLAGDPAAIARGRKVYRAQCAVCHGPRGRGDGPAGAALRPPAADLTDVTRWEATPIGTKAWIVANGIAGTGMPALPLTPAEVWAVLAYAQDAFQPPVSPRTTPGSGH